MPAISLHKASQNELPALLDLEFSAFSSDRISRHSWKDLLVSPTTSITIATQNGAVLGIALLLTARHRPAPPPRPALTAVGPQLISSGP